jgi:hypothetical protein
MDDLVIIESFEIIKTTIADKKHSGISSQVVFDFTDKGNIIADMPNIAKILNILLPTIFPIVISEFFDIDANTFTINSGAEVPNATIVKPITIFGILCFFANEDALSTNKFAP